MFTLPLLTLYILLTFAAVDYSAYRHYYSPLMRVQSYTPIFTINPNEESHCCSESEAERELFEKTLRDAKKESEMAKENGEKEFKENKEKIENKRRESRMKKNENGGGGKGNEKRIEKGKGGKSNEKGKNGRENENKKEVSVEDLPPVK